MWQARSSPWRLSLLLLLALGFVLLGVVIALDGGVIARLVGGVSVLFFGACGVAAVIRLARGRQVEIAVSADGIWWRQWSGHRIDWHDVVRVEIRRQRRQQPFLCFWLRPETQRGGGVSVRSAALSKHMGFGDMSLTTIGTDRSFDELVDAVAAYVAVER